MINNVENDEILIKIPRQVKKYWTRLTRNVIIHPQAVPLIPKRQLNTSFYSIFRIVLS